MTDIVQRLRRGVYPDETGFGSTEDAMKEAADEIERLRAEKAELLAVLKDVAGYTLPAKSEQRVRDAIAKAEGRND